MIGNNNRIIIIYIHIGTKTEHMHKQHSVNTLIGEIEKQLPQLVLCSVNKKYE